MVTNKERDRRMDSVGIDRERMRTYKPVFGKVANDDAGRLWFYDHKWLCIGNMASDLSDIELVMHLEEEQVRQCGAAFELMIKEELLYIAFMKKPELLVYNITNCTYKLYENNIENLLLAQQYNSVFYEESLLFIPVDISKPICVFDLDTHQYTVHDKEKYNGITGNVYRFQNVKKLLLPIYNTNQILVMEPDKLRGRYMELNSDISVNAVYGAEEDLWICQNDKKVIINVKGGKTSYISLAKEIKVWKDPFSGLVKYGDTVIILPRFDKYIYVIELKSGTIKAMPIPYDKEKFDKLGCSLTYGYHIYNDVLYLLPWGLDWVIALNLTDYQMTKKELLVKKDDYCEFIYHPSEREWEEDDLQNYIGWILKH